MGTNRLGPLPRTRQWRQIVGAFVAGAAQVAQESLRAVSRLFTAAAGDGVLIEAVRVLMLLPVAAGGDDFAGALRGVGVDAPDFPEFCDVLAAVSERLDAVTPAGRGRSDVGEMAQGVLAETLSEVVGGSLANLFDDDPEAVRSAFARHRTVVNFGRLAATFFGKLAAKCLEYYLSRELPHHVGAGQRLPALADYGGFGRELNAHCREAARVVDRFAGEWHAREKYQQGGDFDPSRVKAFVHGAFAKLAGELDRGAR